LRRCYAKTINKRDRESKAAALALDARALAPRLVTEAPKCWSEAMR
jgi:hypothetical protein